MQATREQKFQLRAFQSIIEAKNYIRGNTRDVVSVKGFSIYN